MLPKVGFGVGFIAGVKPIQEKKLTSKARTALSDTAFVYPGERKYPIHDIAHGRNALSRVSAHGTPAEKKKVRAAVHSKYPSLNECVVRGPRVKSSPIVVPRKFK